MQDPVTGEPKWYPTPGSGSKGGLSPGSSSSGGVSRSSPSKAVYDAAKAQRAALAAQARENQLGRDFTGQQNQLQRDFTAGQNAQDDYNQLLAQATGLRFNSGESAIDRNAQGGWNEYQSQANNAGIELARRQEARQLAEQFQQAVASANPIAMPALLAAGGGNITNALAGGATALTDTFLTPQAEMLRQTRMPWEPLPSYEYTPETNPFVPSLPAPPPPVAAAPLTPAPGSTPAPPTEGGRARTERRRREREPQNA